ncbi:RluA family pseudouridine synthase [Leeia sp. TBRC 13508]|uniref:RluA family pseudouridine synthase n=1 Tax=Leeia speluncae TaxID=2884804 RepID=A0ABS8D3S1_9NEIS|nr:RluA family pseudouridine synthase [Leeia speluncae]MCB6182824.1 RluA family pseudouridine synthase [Leeia speluncae]
MKKPAVRLCDLPSPLPVRDGIAPSYAWLPEGNWPTIYAFLLDRFAVIGESILSKRLANGEIVDEVGLPIDLLTPYKAGKRIWYYREVEAEPRIPFEAEILFQDAHLLVVDKPHFLPMSPAGNYLKETLLIRLRAALNNQDITPIHRLDRETAGVVMFCLTPELRGKYQRLFEAREVQKTYEAIAPWKDGLSFPRVHQSKMVDGDHFVTMKEVPGEPNSETEMSVLARFGDWALYQLKPHTGRKHQLRVHLASLGIPILHDPFYPIMLPDKGDDFSKPLQLLARSIEFIDPITHMTRHFVSKRHLNGMEGL